MRGCPALAALALALVGCAQLDSAADRDAVHSDLARRVGTELPATPADDVAVEIGSDVVAMLEEPLTEDSAVRIALLNNHDVHAAFERLGIARADLVQAGLLRNPIFEGDARLLFDGGTELELGLSQPFLDLFYRPLRERLAEHEFAAAKLLVTDDLVHLVFAVRRAFVHLRAAQQLALLHQQTLAATAAAHELAMALHTAGNTTDRALAAERLGETRARLDLAAAEQQALEAREPLQQLLGLWGPATAWTIVGDLADDPLAGLDTEHVEARAITASLDLAANRAGIDSLAQRAGLESWRGWLPDGALGLSALRERGGDWGLGPRLALELPLFDRGAGRQTRAAARLRAGLHHHVQNAIEVRSAARLLCLRVVRLAEAVRFLRDVHLPQRAEVVRATLQHYNAMQIGAFDVLHEKQRQLADVREYVTTLRDAHQARLDLMELLAGGSPMAAQDPGLPAATGTPGTDRSEGHAR